MRVYFVRHAEAIERGGDVPDALRYLTPEGRRFFRKTVKRLVEKGGLPDRIFSSPLARALQTAEILAEGIGYRGTLVVTDKLAPGFGRAELKALLSGCEGAKEVALVGHEPDLGDLVTSLLSRRDPFSLKKGEIVALELPRTGARSPAAFLWSAAGKRAVEQEKK